MTPDAASTKQAKAVKPKLATAAKTQSGAAVERTPGVKRIRHRPETRAQMLERLTNPFISLHEASVLLRVCPATVRRYTDSGELPHVRTEGGQRRFRLREVLLLMQQMEARRRKSR